MPSTSEGPSNSKEMSNQRGTKEPGSSSVEVNNTTVALLNHTPLAFSHVQVSTEGHTQCDGEWNHLILLKMTKWDCQANSRPSAYGHSFINTTSFALWNNNQCLLGAYYEIRFVLSLFLSHISQTTQLRLSYLVTLLTSNRVRMFKPERKF